MKPVGRRVLSSGQFTQTQKGETMIQFHEQYLVDEEGNRKAVVVPISSWQHILEALDELDDIKVASKNPKAVMDALSS
jgi:hypothetical protein